jgi:hypothetical protein
MIYICYIIYWDNVVTCMLTVGDDELTMGDDNNTSLEVAKGGAHAERLRGGHMDGLLEEQDM